MAPSLSSLLLPLTALLSLTQAANTTHTYDFDISWMYANPDGLATRPVMGVNEKWPLPTINVTVGDRVIVNVKNSLGNESTSLHFHGLYMNGTNHMDGPGGVTQCSIPPGSSFTYNFTVCVTSAYISNNINGHTLIYQRSNNRAHTGTIPMNVPNTPTAFAAHSS